MPDLSGRIGSAMKRLKKASHELIDSNKQYAIWRHQLVGDRNEDAQNHMGEDPTGFYWNTKDIAVKIREQEVDEIGRKIFYAKIDPVHNDLIITLAGTPSTEHEALDGQPVGYYRVIDTRVDRDPDKDIIATKIITEPDRSGKWGSPE